jgi:hypothetical protein
MFTKMRNFLPMIWRQIHNPIPSEPALGAYQQTKSTWTILIESEANIPTAYKEFFKPFTADGRPIPYTLLVPPTREGYIHMNPEKLVCNLGSEIDVLEKSENTFKLRCHPIEEISYVEFTTILLSSSIKLSGRTRQGAYALSTIKFNTVGDYLFEPILKTIRLAARNSTEAVQKFELDKFDHLIRVNFKFMNYARNSLLAGEKVIHFILQPEIRAPRLRVLGRTFYKTISPTHMSILTDRELIMIREDENQNKFGRYGGIRDYIQLNKIESLTLSEKDNDLLVLSIHLPENEQLEFTYQASAKPELDQLLERFKELAAQKR